jgi:hypothetical protein
VSNAQHLFLLVLTMDVERFVFRLEYYNELAALNDVYHLMYYVRRDGKDEIEINDAKHKRRFLARVHYPALKLEHINVGGKITVYVSG